MKTIWLSSKKVVRHFGAHPERGRAIKALPSMERSAGVRWVRPGIINKHGDFIPTKPAELRKPKVIVHPVVCLTCIGKDMWRVTCDDQFWPQIQTWLVENCR